MVERQPFPGPGLAIRVIGEITKDKLDIVRKADFIFREEVEKAGIRDTMNQYFAALTNLRSVGVMGDGRTYDYAIALRSVVTSDFMTAEYTHIPYEVLDKEKIKDKGPQDLKAALKKFSSILRQGKAEVNFRPEKLVINGVPVTGKIDHLVIDDKAKTIEIYDFKTANYHKEKWGSHATLYKYMLQLLFYKLDKWYCISLSRNSKGRFVCWQYKTALSRIVVFLNNGKTTLKPCPEQVM